MLIRHIKIENYRSIKSVDITPDDIVALVGPNNAGKTNILCALNFVLGERYPTRQGLEITDFYAKDDSRELKIQIWFHENPDNIDKIWVSCSRGNNFEAKYSYPLIRY